MSEDDERASGIPTMQFISAVTARIARRDYYEKPRIQSAAESVKLMTDCIRDKEAVDNEFVFTTWFGFDAAPGCRKKVVDIKVRGELTANQVRRIERGGCLRLTSGDAELKPSYLRESVGAYQSIAFMLIFAVCLLLFLLQPSITFSLVPAQIGFMALSLGLAVLPYHAIVEPSRLARKALTRLNSDHEACN
ncbi:MAG: hypothetical protein ABF296_11485 [Oceanococcaceae bacterium]|jgi:hypothetical protein